MNNLYILTFTLLYFSFISCSYGIKTDNEVATQTDTVIVSGRSADFCGTYSGVIPMPESQGIRASIVLNDDRTFKYTTEYLGELDAIFTDTGNYEVNGKYITLHMIDGTERELKIETECVHLLDKNKKEITGDLAPFYILKKRRNCL